MTKRPKHTAAKQARVSGKSRKSPKRPAENMPDELERLLAGNPGDPVNYAQPSTETQVPWLEVELATGEHPPLTSDCGKWLIFVSAKDVDETWRKIRSAVIDGKLGRMAKVSTAMPNPNAVTPSTRVICVYTYDADDEADVKRVRAALLGLGLTGKLPYKMDRTTFKGRYAKSGARGISRYYE